MSDEQLQLANDLLQMEQLVIKINELDIQYYVNNDPSVTDQVYNSLYERLEALHKAHPEIVIPTSPVGRVRSTVQDGFVKGKHSVPMISLYTDVSYSPAGCINFYNRITEVIKDAKFENDGGIIGELKFDGLGLALKYQDTVLVQALTRGDGVEGEDVTQNAFMIQGIPHVINLNGTIEVRGEVLLPKSSLSEINKRRFIEGQKPYVNCRNAAAGSLRNLDPLVTKEHGLIFCAYELVNRKTLFNTLQSNILVFLRKHGFHVSDTFKELHTKEDLVKYWEDSAKLRDILDFDIDGVVFKVNDVKIHHALGYTSAVPRGSIACKFIPEEVTSVVTSIEIQVGRTGAITPVAKINPVFVGGVTVSSVTLHNQDQIDRLGINVGDTVIVRRAGDVIPEITSVLYKVPGTFELPKICPCCFTPVERNKEQVGVFCPNKYCSARVLRKLEHFVSRPCMNIEDVGPELIKKLYTWCGVRTPMDIYCLDYDDLTNVAGMSDLMIKKILKNIDKSRDGITLQKFIASLGIEGIGQGTARDLAEYYVTLDALFDTNYKEMLSIPNIGPDTVDAWFNDVKENQGLTIEFAKLFDINYTHLPINNKKLAGKTVLFTGTFPYTRDALKEHVMMCSGKNASGVSRNLDYLVVGQDPGNKEVVAMNLGVTILNYDEYIKLTR